MANLVPPLTLSAAVVNLYQLHTKPLCAQDSENLSRDESDSRRDKVLKIFPCSHLAILKKKNRFKPMVEWPAEEGALYTLVLSNLDINTRENRFAFVIFH